MRERIDNGTLCKRRAGDDLSAALGYELFFSFEKSIEKRKSAILEAQEFFEYPFIRTPAKRGSV